MLKRVSVKIMSVLMILVLFNGCVMSTKMTVTATDPKGTPIANANVFVNGQSVGYTGSRIKVSNFVGAKSDITVTKEGYNTARIQPVKQVKVANVLCGILLLNVFAWLWVYGPKAEQHVVLSPEPAS